MMIKPSLSRKKKTTVIVDREKTRGAYKHEKKSVQGKSKK